MTTYSLPDRIRSRPADRLRAKGWRTVLASLLLSFAVAVPVTAQTVQTNAGGDGESTLKQVIVFGRHSVRSSVVEPDVLDPFAVDPYPDFKVPTGYLTPHGQKAAVLLGAYFHDYLVHEGLLTGNPKTDLARSYFRANSIQRSNVTAAMFGTGLIPGITIPVHSFPIGTADPVFDPIGKGVAKVDPFRAEAEVRGIFGSGEAVGSASSGELSLIRSVLFDYPQGKQPPPPTPRHKVDATASPFLLDANTTELETGNVIDVGGLTTAQSAADPFVMQYADGMPLEKVAWGRLTLEALSQQTRLINLGFSIVMRSPYLARVQSSNAASHVLRSMEQAVIGDDIPGAFGDARSRVIVVISSDAYLAGLAGLLDLHWQLPGYQPDFCPPGGALVFELRQARRSKEYFVRTFYTAQTFDQLRDLTHLTLRVPPATMQLLVPVDRRPATDPGAWNGVEAGTTPEQDSQHSQHSQRRTVRGLDVPFDVFQKLVRRAVDRKCVEDPREEVPPGVLTGVPLK